LGWSEAIMSEFLYRLIDTAGGVIGIISSDRASVAEDDSVALPDGTQGRVVEVYDDENGQEGGVVATLVVEDL
jgi:hypothetical protein